jgi:hypothetical protein
MANMPLLHHRQQMAILLIATFKAGKSYHVPNEGETENDA